MSVKSSLQDLHVPLAFFAGRCGGPIASLWILSSKRVELLFQFGKLVHHRLLGGQQLEEIGHVSASDDIQLLRSQLPQELHDLQLAKRELGQAIRFHSELHL